MSTGGDPYAEARAAFYKPWYVRLAGSRPALYRLVMATAVVVVTVRMLHQRTVRRRDVEDRERELHRLELSVSNHATASSRLLEDFSTRLSGIGTLGDSKRTQVVETLRKTMPAGSQKPNDNDNNNGSS